MALFKSGKKPSQEELETELQAVGGRLADIEETLDATGVAWWQLNLKTGSTVWSKKLRDWLDVPENEKVTMARYAEFLSDEDKYSLQARLEKAMVEGQPFTMDHRVCKPGVPESEAPYFEMTARLSRGESGENKLIGIVQDVTHNMEQEQQRKLLSLAVSKTGSGVMVVNRDARVEWLNNAITRIMGYNLEDLEGKDPFLTFAAENTDPDAQNRVFVGLNERDAFGVEIEYMDKFGKAVWVEMTLTPVFNFADQLTNYVVVLNDVTERKRQENEILKLNEELQEKNESVLDSIRYARRIQFAVLPDLEPLRERLPETLVWYVPKDVVSGDFYWYWLKGAELFIAAVDCTGHGVPGAFMSVLGNSLLNEIIRNESVREPGEILRRLNEEVVRVLAQREETRVNDGMDMALCRIDLETRQMQFAGAKRPLARVRNGEVEEFSGSQPAIGFDILLDDQLDKTFETLDLEFAEGDELYLFSDGITDQFGGERGKKLTKKRFYETLVEISGKPPAEKEAALQRLYDDWRGEKSQTDDLLVIGLKL